MTADNPVFSAPSRFSGLPIYAAILISVLMIGLSAYGILGHKPAPPNGRGEDLNCYQAIIDRIRSGEGYYTAAAHELRARGYTTGSVFNWRLPVFGWLMALLPNDQSRRLVAVALALAASTLWFSVLCGRNSCGLDTISGLLLVQGPVFYSLSSDCYLLHEFWAGTLISLSLAAHGRNLPWLSVSSGLAALFVRELALPFILVMAALSLWEGRRREAVAWSLGVVVFAVGFLAHWSIVTKLITDSDRVLEGGWIVFGGWPFVLSTVQVHPYLILAPLWVTATLTPLILLGLAGWRGPLGTRIACTVGMYVVTFLVVGRSFNRYWGLLYTNAMLLGLVYCPYCLVDLVKAMYRKG